LSIAVLLVASACISITPVAQETSPPTAPPPTFIAAVPTQLPATPSPGPTTAPSAPASPSPGHSATPAPTRTPAPTKPAATVDPTDPACSDDAFNLEGFSWNETYRWFYDSDTTPANLDPAATLAVIQTAFDNVTDEHNDCGRPDTIHAKALYMSDTKRTPCTDQADGVNTVAFGAIPSDLASDVIAYTCPYSGGPDSAIAFEADIVINAEIPWALSNDLCFLQVLLEPTITHEAGHVFGLDHVNERQHGELTMSTTINGTCDDSASTLGLGDMLGLEQLYGPNS